MADGTLVNFSRSTPNGGFHVYKQDPQTLKRTCVVLTTVCNMFVLSISLFIMPVTATREGTSMCAFGATLNARRLCALFHRPHQLMAFPGRLLL